MELVNAPARWWPCACLKCVSGLQRLEKDWTSWDAYMSLTWCSNTVQTWRKLATASLFSFIALMGIVASFIGMSFFLIYVSVFGLMFCRLAVSLRLLQLESEPDLTPTGLILEFLVEICLASLMSYMHGLTSAWVAQYWFFSDVIRFFR